MNQIHVTHHHNGHTFGYELTELIDDAKNEVFKHDRHYRSISKDKPGHFYISVNSFSAEMTKDNVLWVAQNNDDYSYESREELAETIRKVAFGEGATNWTTP